MRQALSWRSTRRCALAGALLAASAFGSPGLAETMHFKADLSGASQVPPSPTNGTGTVAATYDSTTKKLSWNGSYSGLTGPPTAAHIHGPAAAGANARLVFWISDNVNQCSQGECRSNNDTKTHPLTSPFQGSAILTDAQAADLMAGFCYVNIHTDSHPRGEIRGQLVKSP